MPGVLKHHPYRSLVMALLLILGAVVALVWTNSTRPIELRAAEGQLEVLQYLALPVQDARIRSLSPDATQVPQDAAMLVLQDVDSGEFLTGVSVRAGYLRPCVDSEGKDSFEEVYAPCVEVASGRFALPQEVYGNYVTLRIESTDAYLPQRRFLVSGEGNVTLPVHGMSSADPVLGEGWCRMFKEREIREVTLRSGAHKLVTWQESLQATVVAVRRFSAVAVRAIDSYGMTIEGAEVHVSMSQPQENLTLHHNVSQRGLRTDSRGEARAERVVPGHFQVRVVKSGMRQQDRGKVYDLRPGQLLQTVVVTLDAQPTISGLVVDAEGVPVVGASIKWKTAATLDHGRPYAGISYVERESYSDGNGHFELSTSGSVEEVQNFIRDGLYLLASTLDGRFGKVRVDSDAHQVIVQLTAPQDGTLSLTFQNPDKEPVPGLLVSVTSQPEVSVGNVVFRSVIPGRTFTCVTDASGQVSFPTYFGAYTIAAHAPGMSFMNRPRLFSMSEAAPHQSATFVATWISQLVAEVPSSDAGEELIARCIDRDQYGNISQAPLLRLPVHGAAEVALNLNPGRYLIARLHPAKGMSMPIELEVTQEREDRRIYVEAPQVNVPTVVLPEAAMELVRHGFVQPWLGENDPVFDVARAQMVLMGAGSMTPWMKLMNDSGEVPQSWVTWGLVCRSPAVCFALKPGDPSQVEVIRKGNIVSRPAVNVQRSLKLEFDSGLDFAKGGYILCRGMNAIGYFTESGIVSCTLLTGASLPQDKYRIVSVANPRMHVPGEVTIDEQGDVLVTFDATLAVVQTRGR